MAVGVPENDVFAAADAVLARGERPTVERVRLELGRGSPARVGALLDQWWERLAERLRGETRLPGLPAEVAQAFVAVWQQANTLAQGVAELALAGQRQVLEEEREAAAAAQAQSRLDVLQARQQAAQANAAEQAAQARMTDLEQLLEQRLAQIDDLRIQREELLAQRDDARAQLLEVQHQLRDSRQQAEQARDEQQRYTREVEDRAYREIDRAREESKALLAQVKDADARQYALQKNLMTSQAALAEVREQRASAQGRNEALLRELEQALLAQDNAREQHHALEQACQQARNELVEIREQAAAERARSQVLTEQLAQANARAATEKADEGRRPARKK